MSGSRFNFSLRRLLSIRENAERDAAVDLAVAHAAEENARQVQESLDEERAHARNALLPPPGQESRVSELQQVAFLIEQLDTHGETARESVAEAERTVEEKRVRLGETLRDRRVLDRLQEREREEWNIAEKREDRSEMDEIARDRFIDRKDANPKAGE